MRQAPLIALVVGPTGAYAAGPGLDAAWPLGEVASRVGRLVTERAPRWVVWSAGSTLRRVIAAGVVVPRTWDLAEVHRLLHGGWWATPGHVVAACRGLPEQEVPRDRLQRPGFATDLLELAGGDDDMPFTGEGHLRSGALTAWATDPGRLRRLAGLALECQRGQERELRRLGGPAAERWIRTAWAESAAAALCLELERDGLPVDRRAAEDLIAAAAGPRPTDEEDAARIRSERDARVLRHVPHRAATDLRHPAQVKELLAAAGVVVPNTRAAVLEPYRHTHPLVDALLAWRKDERIATTYGYRWLDEHVGPDDRLRGGWTACDGAAGRMTAQHGLHNLPAPLRPAVRAAAGHVFVRADLGQVEPRVLAVVSGDRAFADASRSADLYAPVASKLGTERSRAKVAVLAAMYGQRSGAAGEALRDLERAYPVAMSLLDRAYADGIARRDVRTWGGRRIRLGGPDATPGDGGSITRPGGIPPTTDSAGAAASGAPDRGSDAARGRYARNAIIQGAAAELFKAWAATVRHLVAPLGGRIVLCLHDELLVHVPEPAADAAVRAVEDALASAARTWAGGDAGSAADGVRFVADTTVVRRWSDAKD